jgi:hypothetical protein
MKNVRILRGDGVVDGIVLDRAHVSSPGKISIPKNHVRARDIRSERRQTSCRAISSSPRIPLSLKKCPLTS